MIIRRNTLLESSITNKNTSTTATLVVSMHNS